MKAAFESTVFNLNPFALTLRQGSGLKALSKGSARNLGFDKLSPNGIFKFINADSTETNHA